MWLVDLITDPHKGNERSDAVAAIQDAERQAARVARSDVAARVGVDTDGGPYLRGHEHYNELPRSVNELYAMIDALEKRVRELESRG